MSGRGQQHSVTIHCTEPRNTSHASIHQHLNRQRTDGALLDMWVWVGSALFPTVFHYYYSPNLDIIIIIIIWRQQHLMLIISFHCRRARVWQGELAKVRALVGSTLCHGACPLSSRASDPLVNASEISRYGNIVTIVQWSSQGLQEHNGFYLKQVSYTPHPCLSSLSPCRVMIPVPSEAEQGRRGEEEQQAERVHRRLRTNGWVIGLARHEVEFVR